MKLNKEGLRDGRVWENMGYHVPSYDREEMIENTKQKPEWIHFGAGNIFRAFQANLMQQLIKEGKSQTGLIVAEGFDYEIIEKMYRPYDNYSILVTLKSNGEVEKTVIGSISESLILDSENDEEFSRLKDIFASPSLQMASFTITEKGYGLTDGRGNVLPEIRKDMESGPINPESYLGKVCALIYERYQKGQMPLALVSMDNCSRNGDKLKAAVLAFAEAWVEVGKTEEGFLNYVNDESKISFPWSMIDKITPRPDPKVEEVLVSDKIEGMEKAVTSKNTWVAPFVNAEECQYLVIEDSFPNGRPALEEAGVIFTTKETVDKVEKMKVCTCLNPLHTALAIFGCLLGYELISEEMKNPALKKLIELIGYQEGLPVVVDPKIINPKKFIDEVVNLRIPNPFMPDTPQRIATDTSQKLSIRFGETIKAYDASDVLSIDSLEGIPFVFAGWLRYLMGVNDEGKAFTPSPDPLLETLMPYLEKVKLGEEYDVEALITPILKRNDIFGIDLTRSVIGRKVIDAFTQMIRKPGAVKELLEERFE